METPVMQDIQLGNLEEDVLVVLGKGPDDEDDDDGFLEDGDGFELDEFDSMDDFDDDDFDDDYS